MRSPKAFMRNVARPIGLAILFTALGFGLRALLAMLLDIEIPKAPISLVNFILAAAAALVLFPRLKLPFGAVEGREYRRRLGFYLPPKAWQHAVLGIALAMCTLGGMWNASLLTGRYVLDPSTITSDQILFSSRDFQSRALLIAVLGGWYDPQVVSRMGAAAPDYGDGVEP